MLQLAQKLVQNLCLPSNMLSTVDSANSLVSYCTIKWKQNLWKTRSLEILMTYLLNLWIELMVVVVQWNISRIALRYVCLNSGYSRSSKSDKDIDQLVMLCHSHTNIKQLSVKTCHYQTVSVVQLSLLFQQSGFFLYFINKDSIWTSLFIGYGLRKPHHTERNLKIMSD